MKADPGGEGESPGGIKARLRRELRARRGAVGPEERQRAARAAAQHLLSWAPLAAMTRVMIYAALGSELDTGPLWEGLRERGVRVALPRLTGPGTMEAAWAEAGAPLRPGPYGLPQPTGPAARPEELEAVVVPGLGFDLRGGRLGSGRGYYDRFLAGMDALRVGYAFSVQLVERLPQEPHDVAMDAVATEEGVFPCG